jgi:hypothetical protein
MSGDIVNSFICEKNRIDMASYILLPDPYQDPYITGHVNAILLTYKRVYNVTRHLLSRYLEHYQPFLVLFQTLSTLLIDIFGLLLPCLRHRFLTVISSAPECSLLHHSSFISHLITTTCVHLSLSLFIQFKQVYMVTI